MKGRTGIVNVRGFREAMAISLMVIFAFASTLPAAFASSKEKPKVSVPKNVPRTMRAKTVFAARPQANAILPGQSLTLLGDGRSVLIGGEVNNRAVDTVSISDGLTGAPVAMRSKLHHARAWHSATMLPDGSVLVLGGIGRNGEVLRSAELLDPERQTFTMIPVPEIVAQAYHTATLLTDGQVLITGGTGETLLWDFKTKAFRSLSAKLSATRQKHKATLLFDGNLLIEGGVDNNGSEVTTAELFNVGSGSFNFTNISSAQLDQSGPFLSGSLPANGAGDVAVDTLVALRFSKRLRVETLNARSITLSGQEGSLEAKVVPAESGRLAFVTPKLPLLPGMTYTVSVADAVDENGAAVAPASTTFTTKGTSEPADTSSDGEVWNPDWTNFRGNWTNKHEDSPWRSLPLMQAAEGVTALAGQVLTLDGKPLANTTLRIGDKSAQTDNTGRFLLSGLPSGRQVMIIDGRSASRNKKVYGIFKYGVDLTAGKTNPLGFTIWMPRLDTTNVVKLSSPTNAAMKVTNPSIPGLELRLPQGTVIRDLDGQTVTEVSITPIPTNQPPFPLPPNVDVPVYFTIQPGASQIIPPRAQLIYPNFIGQQPGTRIDFYNYDAAEKGWYIYGQGTVTPDGKQIIPDAGVTLYEFSGAMVAGPTLAPSRFIACGRANFGGAGVDLNSGLFVWGGRDLSLGGFGSLSLARTYRPDDTRSRAFGIGASHIYDMYLVGSTFPYTFMDLVGPDGSRIHFNRTSPGTGWSDAVYESEPCGRPSSCTVKAIVKWNGGGWIVIYEDGTKLVFPEAFGASTPQRSAIIGYEDRFGNSLSFVRDSAANLTRITSTSGRWMDFTYDASNRITQARDNIGRLVSYAYDTSGRLASVTNPTSGVSSFIYDTLHRMTQVTDERGIIVLKNEYDSANRVIKQTIADDTPDPNDNPFINFAYTLDSGGRVVQTDVTDPRGVVRRTMFDANGFTSSQTYAVGLPEQQTITYERQAGTNLPLGVTDNIGRKVGYSYDSAQRLSAITKLAGTAEAVSTQYGYSQDCDCDDVTSVTDPLNRTATFDYDDKGNLITITDPLNNSTRYTYNAAGQPTSVSDDFNNTALATYDNGDIASLTDPAGKTASTFVDAIGRMITQRGPDGQRVRYEYDSSNRPVKVIDQLGGVTEFTYDAIGNVLSVKDPRNGVTSFTYDNRGRVTSKTDPLLHTETYKHDLVGNLTEYTDRRGTVTKYEYDAFSRLLFTGYGATSSGGSTTYESTVSYVYDTAGRVVEITDSVSGVITFGYDNFNRRTSKTTPQGTITYTYDATGRRTSMTVGSQPTINYTYDNAARLTQVTQGSTSISFSYDSLDRIVTETRSNGIVVEYGYNQESQLTGMTFKKDSAVLANLTYEYSDGKRVRMGGSLARTGLPQPLGSATYDAVNRLTNWNGSNLTYDNNGNLTSDGVNTYSWNARNQLASISGPGMSASFQYDSSGNRVSKTINGVSTGFLYDGGNVVQELSGTTPVTDLVPIGVDRFWKRTDGAGTRTPLTDAQGSTLALADDSGTLQTQYTYEPFGKVTSTGASSSNASKYTGREDDGTGLYYYRSRYYSPIMQRFISEDPASFDGGDTNLYAYVGNDPVNLVDPSGMCAGFSAFSFIQGGDRTQQQQIDDAVADVLDILGRDNDCSQVFGFWLVPPGRRDVTPVVQALGAILRPGTISPTDRSTGIRLRDFNTIVTSATSTLVYRRPDSAVVNTLGPFFNSARRFGSYQGTSRAGRALAILHEVAHMIVMGHYIERGRRVNVFLIPPNEGQRETEEMSRSNTALVESWCRTELDALNARP